MTLGDEDNSFREKPQIAIGCLPDQAGLYGVLRFQYSVHGVRVLNSEF